jgi:hypothetical protein
MPYRIWQPNAARQLGMAPFTIFPPEDSIVSNVGSSFSSDNHNQKLQVNHQHL